VPLKVRLHGGKVRLHGTSKRGDIYLRTLLIPGARSLVSHAKTPSAWMQSISSRN
jgi:transposase